MAQVSRLQRSCGRAFPLTGTRIVPANDVRDCQPSVRPILFASSENSQSPSREIMSAVDEVDAASSAAAAIVQ